MRQLSPGAKPAGIAHAARRALPTQRWCGGSSAPRRATLAFAPRGHTDGLREANARAVVQAITRQDKEWWADSRTVSSSRQHRSTRVVGMESRRRAQRAAYQPRGVRPQSSRVDRQGQSLSEVEGILWHRLFSL